MQENIITKSVEQRKLFEERLVKKLQRSEEQIKSGQVVDADIVLQELKEKYGI